MCVCAENQVCHFVYPKCLNARCLHMFQTWELAIEPHCLNHSTSHHPPGRHEGEKAWRACLPACGGGWGQPRMPQTPRDIAMGKGKSFFPIAWAHQRQQQRCSALPWGSGVGGWEGRQRARAAGSSCLFCSTGGCQGRRQESRRQGVFTKREEEGWI